MMLSDWLGQQYGGMQRITDPAPQPLGYYGQPAPQAYANASPQGLQNGAAFQPGRNIGQLLMMLPHQGARYLNRPEGMQQAGSFHAGSYGQFR